jgi:hypothetical protein
VRRSPSTRITRNQKPEVPGWRCYSYRASLHQLLWIWSAGTVSCTSPGLGGSYSLWVRDICGCTLGLGNFDHYHP